MCGKPNVKNVQCRKYNQRSKFQICEENWLRINEDMTKKKKKNVQGDPKVCHLHIIFYFRWLKSETLLQFRREVKG